MKAFVSLTTTDNTNDAFKMLLSSLIELSLECHNLPLV